MLSWFYSGGFSGTSCVWENCLYRPGDKPLRSIGKAATSVLPPLTAIHLFSTQETLLQMSLWSRALEFEARLLLPSFIFQNINLSSRSACGGQRDDLPTSAQTAFKSLRLLRRRLCFKSSLHSEDYPTMSPLSRRRDDFKTRGGSARSGLKSFQKI